MFKSLLSAPLFVVIYLVPMSLTYLLPYLGSNSALINVLTFGLNPFFWFHLLMSMTLVLIAGVRGCHIGKEWLLFFPVMALIFDFLPILNLIPFGPSVFHGLAILSGLGMVTPQRI